MEWADARKWISLLEDKKDKALMNPVELWKDLIMTKIEVYFYVKHWCPKSKIKDEKQKTNHLMKKCPRRKKSLWTLSLWTI